MTEPTGSVLVMGHPLVGVKLAALRARHTATAEFRRNLQELSQLLLFEASREWGTAVRSVETPLTTTEGVALAKRAILVPILRAGLGMADGMLQMLPDASVGHLGLYRDEKTLRPVSYYRRLPREI